MNFRSVAQLNDQLLRWSRELPRDIDIIVGVPRSGLLAANLLALHLNVRLTDVQGLLEGRCYSWGDRRRKPGQDQGDADTFLAARRRVLVLDDSVLSGRSMLQVREAIEAAQLPHDVTYAAVYVLPERRDAVDLYYEELNVPRVFEWNALHLKIVDSYCISFEDVLCPRPPAMLDDGALAQWLDEAKPLVVPPAEIGWVVSERAEGSRAVLETWLAAQGIGCRNLVLTEADGVEARQPALLPAWKAAVYSAAGAKLYVEYGFWESVQISRLSGRHVLCTATMQLIHPGTLPLTRSDLPRELHPVPRPTLTQAVTGVTKAWARRVLPEPAVEAIRRWRAGPVNGDPERRSSP